MSFHEINGLRYYSFEIFSECGHTGGFYTARRSESRALAFAQFGRIGGG